MKKFDEWCEVKKQIDNSNFLSFKEREIFMGYIGENVGYEQNGKGKDFVRPVIIYKKLTKDMFIGIPLTTTQRDGSFFFSFNKISFNLYTCSSVINGKD